MPTTEAKKDGIVQEEKDKLVIETAEKKNIAENKDLIDAKDATIKEVEDIDIKIKEIETTREEAIRKLSIPDGRLKLMSPKELIESKNPVESKKEHDRIKAEYKKFLELINCLKK